MEKDKMLSDRLYDPTDDELTKRRIKARKLARRYNNMDEDQWEEMQAILSELVTPFRFFRYVAALLPPMGCLTA